MTNMFRVIVPSLALALVACSSSSSEGPSPAADAGQATEPLTVVIRGNLAGDAATSKQRHDTLAGSVKPRANQLGDVGHYTFLGKDDQHKFLSIDRWTSTDGLQQFLSDKDVAAGLAQFYTAPPSVAIYTTPAGWVTWGKVDYREHGAVVAVTIHGHLANADVAASQKTHDGLAGTLKDTATSKGDVAHNVFLGAQDAQDMIMIDYWTDPTAAGAFYSDPDLQKGFAGLFAGPPEVLFQTSTDWVQW
jgi:hypothetical protein